MEKRIFERIPIKGQVNIVFDNIIYGGVVTNISENGMFIATKRNFPVGTEFEVALLLPAEEVLKIPIKVRRAIITDGFYKYNNDNNGIGVEVLSPSPDYINFVGDLKIYYSG